MEGKTKMTQCDRILRHLEDLGSITSLEAIRDYGIYRLASRITDLKKRGYYIISETKTGNNRYGEPTHWKVYRFGELKVAVDYLKNNNLMV